MKFRFRIGVLSLSLVVGLMAGCGLLNQDPPAISSVTLTDSVDPHRKSPGSPRTVFPAGTTEFFASAKVLQPTKGTNVRAEWYFEGKLVDESDVTFEKTGSRYVAFNLVAASSKPFPPGPYKVKLFLNGSQMHEQEFRVE